MLSRWQMPSVVRIFFRRLTCNFRKLPLSVTQPGQQYWPLWETPNSVHKAELSPAVHFITSYTCTSSKFMGFASCLLFCQIFVRMQELHFFHQFLNVNIRTIFLKQLTWCQIIRFVVNSGHICHNVIGIGYCAAICP